MEYTIKLTFITTYGDTYTITIPKANSSVTSSEVDDAMETILAANSFYGSKGYLAEKSSAALVTTVMDEIEL
ncbi:MAG: DUF2922 domain-containing protein [Clostridiales bacterium]|jgi:hypothetical protein|nr:DUF2922 domain-containing protein [Clostridiales bacterium]